MGTQKKKSLPQTATASAGTLVMVAIVTLAVGLAVGYYFGKSAGSSELPTTSAAPIDSQAPPMDETTFRQREAGLKLTLASSPKDADTLIQLGNLYYDNKKFESAIEYYGKALDIDPGNINVRTDRGTALWNIGKTDEAIAELQKSLQVNPTHPQTLFNLGIVYLHGKNDVAQAKAVWEKLLATNPNYPQRDQLQQMLASMNSQGGGPAGASMPSAAGQNSPGSSAGMEDLFRRMKK